jgi:hypothetical protein
MTMGNSISIQPLPALDKFKLDIYNTPDRCKIITVSSIINVICEKGIIAARGSVPSASRANILSQFFNIAKLDREIVLSPGM